MHLIPSRFDVWVAVQLAQCLARHPLFDLVVASGIRHNVLGGIAYATALFILWVHSNRPGQEWLRRRMLTILLGSLSAIVLTLVAGGLIAWQPPAHYPSLALLFLQYVGDNPNINSFPSQSTALYAAVAAGVYSLDRIMGWLLWVGLVLLVSLPRMYVGGHWVSDIIAGLVLGMVGYAVAHYLFESPWFAILTDRLRQEPRFEFWRKSLFSPGFSRLPSNSRMSCGPGTR